MVIMIIKGEKQEKKGEKKVGGKVKKKKKKSGVCDGSFSGWGEGGGGGREGQGKREGGGQKWGRRLPPPHPSRAGTRWKRSHTAPAARAPQAFIRPSRHHVAPAAAPTGTMRDCPARPGHRGPCPPPEMLSRKGAARSPGARMPPAWSGAGRSRSGAMDAG